MNKWNSVFQLISLQWINMYHLLIPIFHIPIGTNAFIFAPGFICASKRNVTSYTWLYLALASILLSHMDMGISLSIHLNIPQSDKPTWRSVGTSPYETTREPMALFLCETDILMWCLSRLHGCEAAQSTRRPNHGRLASQEDQNHHIWPFGATNGGAYDWRRPWEVKRALPLPLAWCFHGLLLDRQCGY